jgi:GT2 family glycosyltransferase
MAGRRDIMKISIVILSYNDYEGTTGKCLAALMSDPGFVAWEVIVVDNASDAVTKQALILAQQKASIVRFVFNERNLGFAAGNNVGIRMASGDVVILLNSDTIVPSGMVERLAAHFAQHRTLGMVGAVTNAAGNEQCIFISATSVEEKIEEGLRYANSGRHETVRAYRIDFFCVAIARRVLTQVGLLDEEFGRGYYEDFDYSLRVKQAGFELAVAEDVFIYHRGSASFGKVPHETRELLKRNKRRIIAKHGSRVLFQHVRDGNLAVLAQYAARKNRGEIVPEYRTHSRMEYAYSSQPRSWLKRWRYLNKVRKLAVKLKPRAKM